jgi:8-oxo-dGTP pyrophosphatase MutT (NUDIX family)
VTRPGAGATPGGACIARALHPIDVPPAGEGWNRRELDGLLPADVAMREAAVLVGLVERHASTHVLLTLRPPSMRLHAGQVSFPGGRIDPGDDGPVAAALREAREEVGLAATQATLLGFLDPLATISGFRVLPVVGVLDAGFVPRPHDAEVAAVFELPLDWLLDPANLRTREVPWRGRVRRVPEFAPHDAAPAPVWGATAMILQNLRERLAGD